MSGWLKLQAAMPRNAKVAGLPTDAARWAYVASLCEAKAQRNPGQFASASHYRACVTMSVARQLPHLVAAGLLEVRKDGSVLIHDWHEYQIDPTSAARKRRWRERESVP